MAGEIEARLKALDLALPEAKAPIGSYVPFLHLGGQLFISGQLPLKDGKMVAEGRVGADLDLTQTQEAARVCAINILAQAKAALRDLDRIVQLLRLNGFVNAAPGFADHPKVLNAASELMVEILAYYAVPYEPHTLRLDSNIEPVAPDWGLGVVAEHLLRRAASIYGGSNEIQRNIIAKMVLAL